jgi:hypothetical protein
MNTEYILSSVLAGTMAATHDVPSQWMMVAFTPTAQTSLALTMNTEVSVPVDPGFRACRHLEPSQNNAIPLLVLLQPVADVS